MDVGPDAKRRDDRKTKRAENAKSSETAALEPAKLFWRKRDIHLIILQLRKTSAHMSGTRGNTFKFRLMRREFRTGVLPDRLVDELFVPLRVARILNFYGGFVAQALCLFPGGIRGRRRQIRNDQILLRHGEGSRRAGLIGRRKIQNGRKCIVAAQIGKYRHSGFSL